MRHLVRFSQEVTSAKPVSANGFEKWDLTSRSALDGSEEKDTFDAVVADGHYSVSFIPRIPNLAPDASADPTSIRHLKQFRLVSTPATQHAFVSPVSPAFGGRAATVLRGINVQTKMGGLAW